MEFEQNVLNYISQLLYLKVILVAFIYTHSIYLYIYGLIINLRQLFIFSHISQGGVVSCAVED